VVHFFAQQYKCAICNRPVDLKTTKTNERGKAVHEECYVLGQALKDATQPNTHPHPKTTINIVRPS
jgi:hypothetical protein